MWFSRQMPLGGLIDMCRALRHNLGAGLTLLDVFRQLSRRGLPPVRPVAERISAQLARGDSLEEAFAAEKGVFPPLFVDLAVVGEQTGNLAEVFGELESYYRTQQTLRRQFRSKIILPVVQFFAAVFVIAGMLFILGAIAESRGGDTFAPLGQGFKGKAGAVKFLVLVFGTIGGGVAVYLLLTRSLKHRAAVDDLLLRLPVIGPCLEALALGRFALALRLTLETGMSVMDALRLSLRATGNAAYAARADIAVESLRQGEDLTTALAKTRIFPEDFQNIVAVAEEGGRVPEVLRHQAQYYQEEAGRRMALLARAASFGVWALYAVFMCFAIFRIAGAYFGALSGVK